MELGINSLLRSLRAFLGFWLAFLCATICNVIIPIDALKNTYIFKYMISNDMLELRRRFFYEYTHSGHINMLGSVYSLLFDATSNFVGYFREIFVIVTIFHFTPLLQGVEVYFTIPRWFRKLLLRLGLSGGTGESDGGYFADSLEDDDGNTDPPELEDCSHLLSQPSPQVSTATRKHPYVQAIDRDDDSFVTADTRLSPLATDSLDVPPVRASKGRAGERYVFDPVFGVIPQETRDLWQAQESDSNHRKQALLEAISAQPRAVPPVRFSGDPTL